MGCSSGDVLVELGEEAAVGERGALSARSSMSGE